VSKAYKLQQILTPMHLAELSDASALCLCSPSYRPRYSSCCVRSFSVPLRRASRSSLSVAAVCAASCKIENYVSQIRQRCRRGLRVLRSLYVSLMGMAVVGRVGMDLCGLPQPRHPHQGLQDAPECLRNAKGHRLTPLSAAQEQREGVEDDRSRSGGLGTSAGEGVIAARRRL
jgi:hypothetical protein